MVFWEWKLTGFHRIRVSGVQIPQPKQFSSAVEHRTISPWGTSLRSWGFTALKR